MDQTIRNIIKSTQQNKNYKEQYDSYFEPNLTFILKMFVVRYILRSNNQLRNKAKCNYFILHLSSYLKNHPLNFQTSIYNRPIFRTSTQIDTNGYDSFFSAYIHRHPLGKTKGKIGQEAKDEESNRVRSWFVTDRIDFPPACTRNTATHERVLILHFIAGVFMQPIASLFSPFAAPPSASFYTIHGVSFFFFARHARRNRAFFAPFFPRRQRRCDFSARVFSSALATAFTMQIEPFMVRFFFFPSTFVFFFVPLLLLFILLFYPLNTFYLFVHRWEIVLAQSSVSLISIFTLEIN